MQQPRIKQGWLRTLLFLIVYFLILIQAGTMIGFINQSKTGTSVQSVYIPIAINFFASCLLVYLFRKLIDRSNIISLGLSRKEYRREGTIGFITGILLCSAIAIILWLMQLLQWYIEEMDITALLQVLFVFIAVAFAEELVFRGYVLNNLMQSMSPKAALVLSAIIFAFMHSLNPEFNLTAFLNILLAGLLLGINYIFTRNLWFGMMLHLSWNFFQGPLLGFKVSGLELPALFQQNIRGSILLTGGEFGLEGSWLTTIVLAISIPVFYILFEKKYQKKSVV
jgi:membrane protease YdiL (CAAX protease family)